MNRPAAQIKIITGNSEGKYKHFIGKQVKFGNSTPSQLMKIRLIGTKRNEPMLVADLENGLTCNLFILHYENEDNKWIPIE